MTMQMENETGMRGIHEVTYNIQIYNCVSVIELKLVYCLA